MNTSSPQSRELISIPIERLHAHPANSNVMGRVARQKLARQIERNRQYPPLLVREHEGSYQILDGVQREAVLRGLGYESVLCFVWDCDDVTALLLLASLNRLRGEDVPALRGALLDELLASIDRESLLELIPEDGSGLDELLTLTRGAPDPFAELEAEATRAAAELPTTLTFVVEPGEEREVLDLLDGLGEGRVGTRSRGSSLVRLVRHHHGCEFGDA